MKQGLIWKVGDRKEIQTIEYHWLPDFRLESYSSLPPLEPNLSFFISPSSASDPTKLHHYFDVQVVDNILNVLISGNSCKDELIWGHDLSGLFNVKTVYHLALKSRDLPSSSSFNAGLVIPVAGVVSPEVAKAKAILAAIYWIQAAKLPISIIESNNLDLKPGSRLGPVNIGTPNSENRTKTSSSPQNPEISTKNQTSVGPSGPTSNASSPSYSGHKNQTQVPENAAEKNPSRPTVASPGNPPAAKNQSVSEPKPEKNSGKDEKKSSGPSSSSGEVSKKGGVLNNTAPSKSSSEQAKKIDIVESLKGCDFFDGEWVKDDNRKPYYKPESCSVIDEQFNCVVNGRPDNDYQKFKWKPKGCNLPRLEGKNLLEMLRGRRLVFVGDSLNRNMWESLICILKSSAKNPKNVFEAHGRHRFRGEAEYSFVFKDYDSTVEFFVAPFLVQEWEMKDKNGTKRETLRLDLVGKSFEHFKTADIIVFNTGHWWTHDKTSKGEDYYQEGSHVYKELNVLEAFRKAITTWGRWIDSNVNPKKSLVFFRGYSHSHFSGGQWNSGGACDSETVPISDEKYLRPYPDKMTKGWSPINLPEAEADSAGTKNAPAVPGLQPLVPPGRPRCLE
uniref:Trichome birefringence-like N-terminal domain-containing protein n=1 Tax=Cannabis sativa TaxID=3483 RepID=A0A803QP37_CANSA